MDPVLSLNYKDNLKIFINHAQGQNMLGAAGDAKEMEESLYFIHSNTKH